MARITEVYLFVGGVQQCLTMQQFMLLRESDPDVRERKFIPIDSRLYEATPEQYREWKNEQNRRAYLARQNAGFVEVPLVGGSADDPFDLCNMVDVSVDVEASVIASCLLDDLKDALRQLSQDERSLLMALVVDGMSIRECAEKLQIPSTTVYDRKAKALKKLKKIMFSKKNSEQIANFSAD